MTRQVLRGFVRDCFIACNAILLAGIVLCVSLAAAASAAPACTDPDPCGGEPAQLPQLYLPAVLQRTPPMSAEFTPVHPAPTVTPEVSGDVAR